MNVQITSLRAIDCGPLRDVVIDFTTNGEPRPITLLAGANGSGKTTVLELIYSLGQHVQWQMPDSGWASAYSRASYVRLDMIVDGRPLAVEVGERPTGEEPPPEVFTLLPVSYVLNSSGPTHDEIRNATTSQWHRPIEEVRANCQIGSMILVPHRREIVSYLGNQVHREDTLYSFARQYETPAGYEGSLDSYLIWLDYQDPSEYQRTINFLNGLDLDGKRFGVSRKELKATVTTRDGNTHGLAELSSGEQNILELLLGLHRYLLPHSIVLIDEIENSLHPAFQHKIGEALKKIQRDIPFQLIVTSHAPEFLKIFGPENTLLLTEF